MRELVMRPLVLVLGLLSVLWSVTAIRGYSNDGSRAEIATAILSGDKFNLRQIDWIKSKIASDSVDLKQASAWRGAAVARTFLLESELSAGHREISVSEYEKLQSITRDALARSPADSLMWLTVFWLNSLREKPTASDFTFLRMSYWSGRNEGWMAFKRLPVAFAAFGSLPSEIAESALSEFVGLVRAGSHWEAVGLLKGPGWPIRDQLVGRLTLVSLSDRRAFARALAAADINGLSIPGVEDRPSRPF
jgi:hypothetical protein